MIRWHYTPYALPLVLAVIISLGLALYAARRRDVPGGGAFMLLSLAVAAWVAAYALELGSRDTANLELWRKAAYLGAVWIPVLWLAYVLNYLGRGRWMPRAGWAALCVVPLITLALVATNDAHGLLWTPPPPVEVEAPVLDLEFGPWYWVYFVVSYLELAVGNLLLLRSLSEARHLYRRQTISILLAALVPWAGHVLYITQLFPVPDLDPTPFAFAFSGIAFAWALFSMHLFDLAPVARSTVVDEMRDGVIVLDARDRIVDLNPAAAAILGRPATTAIGQAAQAVLPPPITLDTAKPAGAEREIGLTTGGTARYYDLRVGALAAGRGRPQGRLIVLHDITERRRAEEERVRLSREQAARAEAEAIQRHLAFLAEASTILAGSLDYQTTLTTAVRQAVPYLADCCTVDIVGDDGAPHRLAAAHRDAGKTALLFQLGHHAAPGGPDHGVARVLRTGRSDFWPMVDEAQLVAAASTEHQALLRSLGYRSLICAPLVARGRTIGAITFARTSAERQYTEADLVLAEDLAQRVALAVDNARLYQTAQEAVHIRDEFLSIASHELRTPLTSLQLAVQSLLRNSRRGLPPDQEKVMSRLAIVEDQSKRLAGLINDLLDISRISAGRLELEPEATDLAALTRQVVDRFQDELEAAGCPLALDTGTPTPGHWDPLRIEQVITNLLTNAMKYGRGRPIEVIVQPNGAVARLVVRDRGIGIAPDHLERIFERFERAVAPGKFGGMGLGLYITRQIVEAHGGTIGVSSAPAKGATFTVELPL